MDTLRNRKSKQWEEEHLLRPVDQERSFSQPYLSMRAILDYNQKRFKIEFSEDVLNMNAFTFVLQPLEIQNRCLYTLDSSNDQDYLKRQIRFDVICTVIDGLSMANLKQILKQLPRDEGHNVMRVYLISIIHRNLHYMTWGEYFAGGFMEYFML
jgi:hypothetical protein